MASGESAAPICVRCALGYALSDSDERLSSAATVDQPGSDPPDPSGPVTGPAPRGRIGPYLLRRVLGEGGMGIVWEAEQQEPVRRRVALKCIRVGLDGGQFQARFESERQALALMSHPNIARAFDAGCTQDGQPYYAMEMVDGPWITRFCDEQRLDIRQRLELFIEVCRGIQHAHQRGVIHRDIKPSNILIQVQEGRPVPKVIDFGVAKAMGALLTDRTLVTRMGQMVGTPEYMSPEQAGPAGFDVDTRTDVYSLGTLLYELLTGELPFGTADGDPDSLRRRIREEEPVRPSARVVGTETIARARRTQPAALARALRGDLDWIVLKALAKDRARRYATPDDLAADVGRYLAHEPVLAGPPSTLYRTWKFVRRNRTAVSLASLAIAASAAGLIGTLVQSRTARAERDFAFRQLSRAEAINALNSFLLSDAAPSGKPFTVNDLLKRAEQTLSRRPGGDDDRVDLLISIGRQYDLQDEDEKARAVLEEAYRLSRRLSDPSTRGRASCVLASVLSRGAEQARAEPLIREGLAEIPDEPRFALDRIVCLLRGAHVSFNAGEVGNAITRALEARRTLQRSPFDTQSLELDVLIDLAGYYIHAGQFQEAIASFEKASSLLSDLGRDDTRTAATLFNNWGFALDRLGRPIDAGNIYRRAIDVSRDDEGEEAVAPMLLLNYARALGNQGRLEEAADYGERAYAKARKAGNDVVTNQALLQRAGTCSRQGNLDGADRLLDEVELRLRSALPAGHHAFASLASQRALVALGRGDASKALALSDEAVAILEASMKAGRQGTDVIPGELVKRAEILLELRQFERAESDASRAVAMLEETLAPGVLTANAGRAYLALGGALLARGRAEEARAALRTSLEHLESALGADHPDTRRARLLADAGAAPSL